MFKKYYCIFLCLACCWIFAFQAKSEVVFNQNQSSLQSIQQSQIMNAPQESFNFNYFGNLNYFDNIATYTPRSTFNGCQYSCPYANQSCAYNYGSSIGYAYIFIIEFDYFFWNNLFGACIVDSCHNNTPPKPKVCEPVHCESLQKLIIGLPENNCILTEKECPKECPCEPKPCPTGYTGQIQGEMNAQGVCTYTNKSSCKPDGVVCTQEVRTCPDGSPMPRDLKTCRWEEEKCCPVADCACPTPTNIQCGRNEKSQLEDYIYTCSSSNQTKTCKHFVCKPDGPICTTEYRGCPDGSPMPRDLKTCRWEEEKCRPLSCTCPAIAPPVCRSNEELKTENYTFTCNNNQTKSCSRPVCKPKEIACTAEYRACPDGSPMPRNLTTCRWEEEKCRQISCACPIIQGPHCLPTEELKTENYTFTCNNNQTKSCSRSFCKPKENACTLEYRTCPDGSPMLRNLATCQWLPERCSSRPTR